MSNTETPRASVHRVGRAWTVECPGCQLRVALFATHAEALDAAHEHTGEHHR